MATRLEHKWLVGLVLKISDAPPEVVVAHQTQEGHDRAVRAGLRPCAYGRGDTLELERCGSDGQKGQHLFSIRGPANDTTVRLTTFAKDTVVRRSFMRRRNGCATSVTELVEGPKLVAQAFRPALDHPSTARFSFLSA